MMTPDQESKFRQRASKLLQWVQLAEGLAAEIGLWRTMHTLNKAKRELGYEIAIAVDPKNANVHRKARAALERNRA